MIDLPNLTEFELPVLELDLPSLELELQVLELDLSLFEPLLLVVDAYAV